MKVVTTKEAAKKLGVSDRRIRALIAAGKLPAHQLGREYAIEESALDSVRTYGVAGRPPKKQGEQNGQEKLFKTIFDICPEVVGSIKEGLPIDLSTNKKYLEGLGQKSLGKKEALTNE